MRRIKVATFVSLDGVMQAPGGPEEDPTNGFRFGGWVAPHFDEELGSLMGRMFEKPFDLLLGRKTYDIFAAHWPHSNEEPIASLFNGCTKYVASRSARRFSWANSQSLGSDIVAKLREIKAGDGPDLLVQGSSDLLQTLLANGLIDEINLLTFPILLGKGKRLFGDTIAPSGLKLASSQAFPSGVVASTYIPDGDVRTGDFGLAEPSPEEIQRRASLT